MGQFEPSCTNVQIEKNSVAYSSDNHPVEDGKLTPKKF